MRRNQLCTDMREEHTRTEDQVQRPSTNKELSLEQTEESTMASNMNFQLVTEVENVMQNVCAIAYFLT